MLPPAAPGMPAGGCAPQAPGTSPFRDHGKAHLGAIPLSASDTDGGKLGAARAVPGHRRPRTSPTPPGPEATSTLRRAVQDPGSFPSIDGILRPFRAVGDKRHRPDHRALRPRRSGGRCLRAPAGPAAAAATSSRGVELRLFPPVGTYRSGRCCGRRADRLPLAMRAARRQSSAITVGQASYPRRKTGNALP